jgi:nucleotide-binding universal stress UspA family protein
MHLKILLAVDGSKPYREALEVELVTVHLPKLRGMGVVVSKGQIQQYYDYEGNVNLADAKKSLTTAGIKFRANILVGPVAEAIVNHAKDSRCDLIYIGSRGMTAAPNAVLGSTATKVLHIATLPVLLVR